MATSVRSRTPANSDSTNRPSGWTCAGAANARPGRRRRPRTNPSRAAHVGPGELAVGLQSAPQGNGMRYYTFVYCMRRCAVDEVDVIVVGTGNAAFSAALSARERGARVLMLEKGPPEWVGGNTWFTAGAFRLAHGGLNDLLELVEPPDQRVEVPAYPEASYENDMRRVTSNRCDPNLTRILVTEAREAAIWMRAQGIRWSLMTERQAHVFDGRIRFWGGLAVGSVGGGAGMIKAYCDAARRTGIEVQTDSAVEELVVDGGAVVGVRVRTAAGRGNLFAAAVVLASGGFEANAMLRAGHLGPNWQRACVRGTPHNTGVPLQAALAIGAQAYGQWDGCHAIAWDAEAPPHGDRLISNRYSRQAYPWGVVVNLRGKRFVDEGADFRNYTYARYGAEILDQPRGLAFQIFDAKAIALASATDYGTANASRFVGQTIGDLSDAAGIDRSGLEHTVNEYNAAVTHTTFDPTVLDGKKTLNLKLPKSNWAQRLDSPPFVAFAVRCGITFTFGGLRIDETAAVLGRSGARIPGLFAAGEIVGGLFYDNYPGGAGLAVGSVFGRRAGHAAAVYSSDHRPQRMQLDG